MRNFGWIGSALVVAGGVAANGVAQAGDTSSQRHKAPADCRAPDAPYREYDCLDTYLGDGFLERLINYYRLEWGHEKPPTEPNAPGRVAGRADDDAPIPVYRVASRRNHAHRRNSAGFRR
jgi:hypothetical protein